MGPRASNRRADSGVPVSTKVACVLGALLVLGGFLLAVWQRVAPWAESTPVPAATDEMEIPGLSALLPAAGVIVAVVVLIALLALSRGIGRHDR